MGRRRKLITKNNLQKIINALTKPTNNNSATNYAVNYNNPYNDVNYYDYGDAKSKPPISLLIDVEFDSISRRANIKFRQEQDYRTVERYTTMNYQKYPVYSEWKTKSKTFNVSIKLDNQTLETLLENSNNFVRQHAFSIVSRLKDIDKPSWFLIEKIQRSRKAEKKRLEAKIAALEFDYQEEKESAILQISELKSMLQKENQILNKDRKTYQKIENKIIRANKKSKFYIIYSIFSFGLYLLFKSDFYKTRLERKFSELQAYMEDSQNNILVIEDKIAEINKNIDDKQIFVKNKVKEIDTQIFELNKNTKVEIKKITPLSNKIKENEFISLHSFLGLSYEKIAGCYIIRNTINGKCYVGQSKDIHKRIKQHFHGVEPANIIFAEDYYSTDIKERPTIFELKIVRCETKDELDSTERNLIEDYQAFTKGYNSTAGNK